MERWVISSERLRLLTEGGSAKAKAARPRAVYVACGVGAKDEVGRVEDRC